MRVDVSDLLDGTSAFVEASLYAPASPGLVTELLVALHGAGYDRRYYDIDSEGYSFAEYFTARGYHVLAIDHLGMGRSTQPESEPLVTRTAVADANHRMVRHAQAQLSAGGAPVRVTCMAHSMGGMLGIVQQARHHSFERLAIAGWSNIGVRIDDGGITQARVAAARGYLPAPRRLMHDLFYLPDVPEAMIALDACCASLTPAGLGRDAMTPDAVAADAAQIRCPVLVLFGEVDTSPDPAAEVRYYASSPDITLVRLEGSAHIQHLASSRQRFWQRLESWLRAG
ncbi:MAG: hypothetical protein JWQ90_3892 [Hydrocarboniphaga sp.]|nr:hypothetical protein [Hydrocarboniphaga sp.]